MISGIIKLIRGKCYQPSRTPRLITLTETLIIPDIAKTESHNCFIIQCFQENNDQLILKIMHYAQPTDYDFN